MPKLGKNKGRTHVLKPNDGHLDLSIILKWKRSNDKHQKGQKESVSETRQA